MQNMDFNDVVKAIEESNKRVDEVLKAAKLQRNEKQPMPQEYLGMILNYVMGALAMILGFILIFAFMYFYNC